MPRPSPPAPYALADGRLELTAIDEARNIRRRYVVELCGDLFGFTLLETAWGRVGGHVSRRRWAFGSRDEAVREASRHLRRRASAERRIGVAYKPVEPQR